MSRAGKANAPVLYYPRMASPRPLRFAALLAGFAIALAIAATPAAAAYTRPSVVVSYPADLAISPDGTKAYVARTNPSVPAFTSVDLTDFLGPNPLFDLPVANRGVATSISPNGGAVITLNSTGTVDRIFGSTDSIAESAETSFANPVDVAAPPTWPTAQVAYALNGPVGAPGTLTAVDFSPGTPTATPVTTSLPQQSHALAVSPDGLHAYVAHTYDATLKRVTLTGGGAGTIASVAIADTGYDVVVDAAGAYAYVAGTQGTVSRVRLSDFTAAGTSADLGDGELRAIAMSADGRHVFTAFEGSGGNGPTTFIALDAATLEVARTLALPDGSRPTGIGAATGYAYVTLYDAVPGTLMRIELQPDAPRDLSATAGDGSARIAFTVDDPQVRTIQYSVDGGDWTGVDPAGTASPVTVPGLANGRSHAIRLRAVDGLAVSPASDAVSVTPAAAPSGGSSGDGGKGAGSGSLRTAKPKTTRSAITTSFTASGPGRATITGTVVTAKRAGRARAVTACTGKATVRRAGTVRMTCTLTKRVRALRRKGAVRVRLVTAFTPTGGTRAAGTRTVVLKQG